MLYLPVSFLERWKGDSTKKKTQ